MPILPFMVRYTRHRRPKGWGGGALLR